MVFFICKNSSGRLNVQTACLHYYLKNCPQHALNFLPEPHKQGCFIVGKATVGSIKVPTPVYFHKCRQFMMALGLPVLFKIRLKLDQSMQLAKRHMTDNLQSRPLRLLTPCCQILLIQQILLRRDSRVHDIVDFLQNIRAVTRTHQLFRRRGRRLTRMKRCATFRITAPRLTGAKCSRHS